MRLYRKILFVSFISFGFFFSRAQNNSVSIGSTSTKSSAVLWLNSPNGNQGLIIPVGDRTKVSTPEKGMVIFDTNQVYFHDGTQWNAIGGAGGGKTYTLTVNSSNQLVLSDGTTSTPLNVPIAGDVSGTSLGSTTVSALKGKPLPANFSAGVLTSDASGNLSWAPASSSGLTLTTIGSSGVATLTSGTLNIPNYTLAGLGGISLTSLSASAPLSYNNVTGAFSIPAATNLADGYLTKSDWSTFNGKQGAITLTTTGTSGAATLVGNTLNIPQYTAASETDPTVKAINGIVKGTGTSIGAAVAGTDYLTPTGNGSGLTGLTATQIPSLDAAKITTGTFAASQIPTGTTANKIVQLDGTGKLPAVDGSQLTNLPAGSEVDPIVKAISGIVKSNGTTISAAVAGTDYLTPTGNGSGLTGLTATQIPSLDAAKITTGTFAASQIPTGTTANKIVQLDGTGKLPAVDGSQLTNLPAGSETDPKVKAIIGIVKSDGTTISTAVAGTDYVVTESDPTVKAISGIVKGTGTSVSVAVAGTDYLAPFGSQTAKFFYAAPNGSAGAPTFRAIVASDLPTLNQSTTGSAGSVTNALTIDNTSIQLSSGTTYNGSTAVTMSVKALGITNSMLAGSIASSKLVGTDINTVGTITGGIWNGTKISEAFGGTNQTTYAAGDILYASAASVLGRLAIGTPGQVLTISGGSLPSWATPSTGWSLTGNAGTDGGTTNFIGTTDAKDFAFKTNGIEHMRISQTGATTLSSTLIGGNVLSSHNLAASGSSAGLYGESDSPTGAGVFGNSFVGGDGVHGFSSSGFGTSGFSTTGIGIYGQSAGAQAGTYGYNTSTGPGLVGTTTGTGSAGVFVINNGSSTATALDVSTNGTGLTASFTGGKIKIVDGTQGLGKVLTSDAGGIASWQAVSGTGTVTNVTTTAPLSVINGTSVPSLSIAQATATTDGYLSSADWNTFNGKQGVLTLTTTGTSGVATLVGNTLNIPNYAGTSYTAGTGLTLTTNTFSVNPSQNISTLSNLSTNGLIKTSGGTGALSIATAGTDYVATETDPAVKAITGLVKSNGTTISAAVPGTDYLTTNQTVTLSGDITGSGTTAITTAIGASKVTNTMLAGSIASSKLIGTDITTVGTITSGIWNGTKISEAYGGTNQTTYAAGDILYASAASTLSKLAIGTPGQVLTISGGSLPSWATPSTGWSLTGNAGTDGGTTNFIGTTDAKDLVFKTNGGEVMRLLTTGSVNMTKLGIGTTTPTQVFDVTGSEGRVVVNPYLNGPGATALMAQFTNTNSRGPQIRFQGAVGGSTFYDVGQDASGNFVVENGADLPVLNINSNGAIGVGTIPSYGTAGQVFTSNGSANAPTWQAASSGWNLTGNTGTDGGTTNFIGTTDAKDLVFKTNNIEYARLSSTGNFGVGIVYPQATLHISNSAPRFTISNSASNTTNGSQLGEIWFNDAISSSPQAGIRVLRDGVASGDAPTYMSFFTTATGNSSNSEHMRLDKDGNLTIWGANNVSGNLVLGGALMPGNLPGAAGQVLTSAGASATPTWTTISGSGWGLTGNTGTTPATNFIGTTDNVALEFKVNNQHAGKIDPNSSNQSFGYNAGGVITSGFQNSFFGATAGQAVTSGNNNTAVGYASLVSNITSNENTAVGYATLNFNTGAGNTAIGSASSALNTTGGSNTSVGYISMNSNKTGSNNLAIGVQALYSNVAGSNATAIGTNAMQYSNSTAIPFTNGNVAVGFESLRGSTTASANTGFQNTAIGFQALQNNSSGEYNTASGHQVLLTNSTGVNNTGNGYRALYFNTSSDNTAMGYSSLLNNSTGSSNTALGSGALQSNTTGGSNTTVGYNSQYLNTAGINNTSLGHSALRSNTNSNNTSVGYNSLSNNTSGASNTVVGTNAGVTNTTGSNNTLIGNGADVSSSALSNATAIGNGASVTTSNTIQLGNTAVTTVNVGTGTTTKLVTGGLQVTGGAGTAGQVLTSDAAGNGTWQAAGAGSGWTTTGNGATVDATNFIGTTDLKPFNIRVNNLSSGRIDPNLNNTFFGYQAGNITATGSSNTGLGYFALTNLTGGIENVSLGYGTLKSNRDAGGNVAVGKSALFTINYTNGGVPHGTYNTAVGYEALYNTNATTLTDGYHNSAFGNFAGHANTTGTNNTFLGDASDASSGTLSNATAVGANAYVAANNSLVLGSINGVNGATSDTKVGIGTTTPSATLEINGNNTNPLSLQVLESLNGDQVLTITGRNVKLGDVGGGGTGAHMFVDGDGTGTFQFLNGTVGIGTTTPTAGTKLDVNGTINIGTTTGVTTTNTGSGHNMLSIGYFNASGSAAAVTIIKNSANVSSTGSRIGTGIYDITLTAENFTTITDYIIVGSMIGSNGQISFSVGASTNTLRVTTYTGGGVATDGKTFNVVIYKP